MKQNVAHIEGESLWFRTTCLSSLEHLYGIMYRTVTHIDHPRTVAPGEVEEHRGFIEGGQCDHVLNHVYTSEGSSAVCHPPSQPKY